MQQRLGLDVSVEESCRAADLRQPEPNAQKVGLVAHDQGNTVPLLQLHSLEENMSESVAARLDVPVGVDAPIVDHKRLVRDTLRLLDESVEDREHAGRQLEHLQFNAVPDHLQQKKEVPPKVWEVECLQNVDGDKARGQSGKPSQRQSHVCRGEAVGGHGADCRFHCLQPLLYLSLTHTHTPTHTVTCFK